MSASAASSRSALDILSGWVTRRLEAYNEDRIWLWLSVGFGAICSLFFLYLAFIDAPNSTTDDGRMFLSYMPRWDDPTILRNDLIADYWESVSPWTFQAIYRLAWLIGIPPELFIKILPALLVPLAMLFSYRFLRAFGVEAIVAFAVTIFVLYHVADKDVVISGTPRALWPILLPAILDGLARRNITQTAIAQLLLAGSYPQLALVMSAVIGLTFFDGPKGRLLDLSRHRFLLVGIAAVATVAGILPFVLTADHFGPTMTIDQARDIPTFSADGRGRIFEEDGSLDFWCGSRIGFMNVGCDSLLELDVMLLGAAMVFGPVVLFARSLWWPGKQPNSRLPLFFLIASICWFLASTTVLFKLHLPNRYSVGVYTLTVMSTGTVLFSWLREWLTPALFSRIPGGRWLMVALAAAGFGGGVWAASEVDPKLRTPRNPALLAAIEALPKGAVVGGFVLDLDFLPMTTNHATLFNRELAVAYQAGYFLPILNRMVLLRDAVLTGDPAALADKLKRLNFQQLAITGETLDSSLIPFAFRGFFGPELAMMETAASWSYPSLIGRLESGCRTGLYGDTYLLDVACLIRGAEALVPAAGNS